MKDLKPNQKIYLSLLCIPIPSSSSIIDTHTHKQSKYYYDIKPTSITRDMIPFLTRMSYTQCRDLFAFRVCWVSLSLPLVVDVWILFSPVYTAICFFWVMMKVWDRLFFEILPRLYYTSLDTVYTARWVDICWIAKTIKTFILVFGCF